MLLCISLMSDYEDAKQVSLVYNRTKAKSTQIDMKGYQNETKENRRR